jgi:hypothetical protein
MPTSINVIRPHRGPAAPAADLDTGLGTVLGVLAHFTPSALRQLRSPPDRNCLNTARSDGRSKSDNASMGPSRLLGRVLDY